MLAQHDPWTERPQERRIAQLESRVRSLEDELRRMRLEEESRRWQEKLRPANRRLSIALAALLVVYNGSILLIAFTIR